MKPSNEKLKPLEPVFTPGANIVMLYLQKLDKLTDREREVLIKSIDLLNNPMFITDRLI